jgi:hypothetical protein
MTDLRNVSACQFYSGVAASGKGRGMSRVDEDALYTVRYFALEVARIHPVTVYQAIIGYKSYPIPPFVRIGRSIRFRGRDILDWMESLRSDDFPRSNHLSDSTEQAQGVAKRRGRPPKSVSSLSQGYAARDEPNKRPSSHPD